MKVLLTYPSVFFSGPGRREFPMPPFAIYYLAGVLRAEGFEVRLIDPSFFEHGVRGLHELPPETLADVDALAISTTSYNWCEARLLIEEVKKVRPDLPVIAGGVHPTHCDEHVLVNSRVDWVIRGEAEHSFPALLHALERGTEWRDIPGLSYRDGGGVVRRNPNAALLTPEQLARMPHPAYDLLPRDTYSILPIETSRGCHFNCFFCSVTHRLSWRAIDPAYTAERVQEGLRQAVVSGEFVCFVDDCFSTRTEHVRGVADQLLARTIRHGILVEARVVDLIRPGVIEALGDLNMAEIQVGVECGYDDGLRRVRKGGTTIARVRECADRLSRAGLSRTVMWSYILGLPWEGEEECLKTVDFAAGLVGEHGGFANLCWWFPFPSYGWDHKDEYDLNLDFSMFDTLYWYRDPTFLSRIYPHLNTDSVARIRDRIAHYRSDGYNLSCP